MPRPLKLLLVTPKIEFTDDLEPEPSAQAGGFAPAVAAGDVDGQQPHLSQTITLDFRPEQIGIQFHHKTDRVHNVYPGRCGNKWDYLLGANAICSRRRSPNSDCAGAALDNTGHQPS